MEVSADSKLLVLLYTNLARMYKTIAVYDRHEYYKMKILQAAGFPIELDEEEEEDEGDDLQPN